MKKKHSTSIFFQIALLVFSAIVIIIIIIFGAGSMILHHNMPKNPGKSFLRYVDGVPAEIGIPPVRENIQKAAREYGLIIIYKGPEYKYATELNYSLSSLLLDGTKNNETGLRGRYIYVVKKIDNHTFILASTLFGRQKIINTFLIFAIIFLISLLLIVHQVIRSILSPVKFLITGVNEVKEGNFSYIVPVKKQDELGRLSSSFNAMTAIIKKMIKAKEQLLLDVSHELCSPLTRMKINVEFIKDQKVKQSISEDMREMEHMIKEILETEKINQAAGTIHFEKVDITALVIETAKIFVREKEEQRENGALVTTYRLFIDPEKSDITHEENAGPFLLIHTPRDQIIIHGNPTRLKILFRNIIENAMRYSEKKPVEIKISHHRDTVVIGINDQGKGIPENELPFIFEPFYRADFSRSRETGGYGLGMYLCKKIADLHHGIIKIKSSVGTGTSVIVTLPRKMQDHVTINH